MEIFTVSLFGHRDFNWSASFESRLEEIVRDLLWKNEYVEFLIGREGEFDIIAASVIRRVLRAHGSSGSSLVLVLPYAKASFLNNEEYFYKYYDDIEICDKSAAAFYKSAIQIRNRAMVDRSDLAVFYVERENGGAYQTMKYAQKTGRSIINLAEDIDDF